MNNPHAINRMLMHEECSAYPIKNKKNLKKVFYKSQIYMFHNYTSFNLLQRYIYNFNNTSSKKKIPTNRYIDTTEQNGRKGPYIIKKR